MAQGRNNVCLIVKSTFPYDTRLMQQAKLLAQNNFHVDVICLRTPQDPSSKPDDRITMHGLFEKKPKENFLEYLFSSLLFGMLASLKLLRLRSRKKISVVMVGTLPEFLVFFVCWVKLTGTRLILDGRDLTVELLKSRWQASTINLVKEISIIIERLAIFFCDDVITASNGFMRSLVSRNIPQKKLTVIFNTSDTSIFKPDPARRFIAVEHGLRLIYHGTVAARFGIIIGVEALSHVREVIPGVKLVIHGDYHERYLGEIKQRIEQLDLHDNVELNKCISLQEIYSLVKSMHLGIVPYLSDPFMNQALSTKTFEYVASGLPVVASRLRSCEELFDDACIHYATPGDPWDLAEKIIEIAQSPKMQKRKSEAALVRFQDYSNIVMGERFLSLVKKQMV